MLQPLLLLAIAALLPLNASAQRDPTTQSTCYSRLNHDSVRACIKDQSTAAANDLEEAEKRLAQTIKAELHNNRTKAQQRLTQANSRYREYRKSQCEFQSEAASGKKSAPDRQMLCTTALDQQRTRDLNATTETLKGSDKS